MSLRVKTALAAALPAVLLAVTISLQHTPSPSSPAGARPGADGLDDAARRSAQLDEDLRAVTRVIRAKKQIAEFVARRRLGLLEGAGAFRALDATRPAPLRVPARLRDSHPDCSDEEAYCRCLITWVGGLGDRTIVEELEAQLNERLKDAALLRLPAIDLGQYLPPDLLPGPPGEGGSRLIPTPAGTAAPDRGG
jgi:hypothetical protein